MNATIHMDNAYHNRLVKKYGHSQSQQQRVFCNAKDNRMLLFKIIFVCKKNDSLWCVHTKQIPYF